MSVSRRHFLRIMTVGSGAALLSACAPQAAAPAPTSAPAPVATPQVVPTQPAPQAQAKPAESPAAQAKPTESAPAAKPAAAAPTAAPAAAKPTEVRDGEFVVVDGTEPASLDPAPGTGPFQHPMNAMYEGLTTWNARMELQPALATAWEVTPDGKTWTFRLRPGVTFHDGTPFTSAAVKATVDHLLDADTGSSRRGSYTLIKDVAMPDDNTVRITTDPPTPDLPFLMADGSMRIISPTALQKFGKDFGRNPVGTGPYKFVEWIPNQRVVAEANGDYWGAKPGLRRFVYRPIPEPAGRVVALRTGEADVVLNLPGADVEALRGDANLTINVTPGLTIVEAEPRQSKPPFNDVKVRYALNHAIDKNAIITSIMRGAALPLTTPSIPGLFGTYDFEPLAFDPAKARQLLTEAGHANGIDATIRYVSGRWAGDDQVAEAMQGFWNNVGVRTTIMKIQSAELVPQLSADPDTMAGTVFLLLKTSEYVDYHLYRMYHSDATTKTVTAQRYAYGNPEVDRLLSEQQRTFESDKRLPLLQQAQELIWKDQPLVFLMHQANVWGQRKTVSGFEFIPTNNVKPGTVTKS